MSDRNILPLILIDEIKFPGYLIDRLKVIAPELTAELRNKTIDINSGYLPYDTSQLRYPDNINIVTFFWIVANNEIIKTINLILFDTREFVCEPNRFSQDVEIRLKLYIRSIFYEIFRFREIFHTFLKKLKGYGIFTNKEVTELKYEFGQQFKETVKIRNNLVHTDFPWPGENFYKLAVVECARQLGKALYDQKVESVMTKEDIIADIYHETIPTLIIECQYVSAYIANITDNFTNIIEKSI